MELLLNLTKPAAYHIPKTPITKITSMVELMIDLKLITLGTHECTVTVRKDSWTRKHQLTKGAWCNTIINAWFVMRSKEYSATQKLTVITMDGFLPQKMAEYSVTGGFKEYADGSASVYYQHYRA